MPLLDLPNHIAREHLLFDPALQRGRDYYEVHWQFVPNLAIDLWVFAFHGLLSIDLAIRLFLATSVVQLFWGVIILRRRFFGAPREFSWIAALLAVNGPLLLGLVNLVFALGMMLWAWAILLQVKRPTGRILLTNFAASMLLVSHLFAAATFAVIVAGSRLHETWQCRGFKGPRRFIFTGFEVASGFIVPVGLCALAIPAEVSTGPWIGSSLHYKFWAVATILGIYHPLLDTIGIVTLGSGAWLLRRHLTVAGEVRAPAIILLLLFVVAPFQIGQGTWVDARFPIVLALLGSAGIAWAGTGPSKRVVASLTLAWFLTRGTLTAGEWLSWQPVYASYRSAFARLPDGAKLLPLNTHSDRVIAAEHPPLAHIDALAVVERGVFIPTLFTDLPHELLRTGPGVLPLTAAFDRGNADPADYDAVLMVGDAAAMPAGMIYRMSGIGFTLASRTPLDSIRPPS